MANETPFEASYENLKQSIIQFASMAAQQNNIPVQILNLVMYEIGLEARNSSYAIVLATSALDREDKTSDSNQNGSSKESEKPAPKTITMKTEDALKELERTGVKIEHMNTTDNSSE